MTVSSTTLRAVMQAVFPNGYIDHAIYLDRLKAMGEKRKPGTARVTDFSSPPASAVDLFALTGHLLLKSGAYHHVGPLVDGTDPSAMIVVSKAARTEVQRIGTIWRGAVEKTLPPPPAALLDLWRELVDHLDAPLFTAPGRSAEARDWWRAAIELFCIADEAAQDIGFHASDKSAQAEYIEVPIRLRQAGGSTGARGPITLSSADPDQVCVLPKSRTPKVGCTIRSLSHNLALLPPRGLAGAHWSLTPTRQAPQKDGDPAPFNLVVIPMPFDIRAKAFSGVPSQDGTWGWFDVNPHWCPYTATPEQNAGFETFFKFVTRVLDAAASDTGEIHCLVFPEAALSYGVLRELCERLKERPGFELLISGLFDAPMPGAIEGRHRRGNFTAMARFTRAEGECSFDLSVREKHHRWRLDAGQIETYALGSSLDVNRGWWEHIDILGRSLDVFVMRGGATVTTLICEDLARNDPCQELVRGIGPNFVVALLMDGPQRRDRWPARYATVLAEDPGSSVLSVTSYGLLNRTNNVGAYPPADQIGLFRDDTGKTTEIRLPSGAQGVCVTLQPTELTEHTLDGRPDKGDAQSWRLSGIQPVRVSGSNIDITAGRWPGADD
ncbi:hypothetical protein [Qipengyuania qiaonensis]|uniref:Uncharacterized protein n=1 Tax=Qipengyuania qiaonensis TaxID=2867240 RepID=A0ABS7JAS7_9SPHN|nr:hypothetical protein [Qipengyuania qiaonensis]MBX7482112.1 hypothetical protein [Qipengyuania qiaonensis]